MTPGGGGPGSPSMADGEEDWHVYDMEVQEVRK